MAPRFFFQIFYLYSFILLGFVFLLYKSFKGMNNFINFTNKLRAITKIIRIVKSYLNFFIYYPNTFIKQSLLVLLLTCTQLKNHY